VKYQNKHGNHSKILLPYFGGKIIRLLWCGGLSCTVLQRYEV